MFDFILDFSALIYLWSFVIIRFIRVPLTEHE